MAGSELNLSAHRMDPQRSSLLPSETLSRSFERQAEATPDGIAIQFGCEQLTYRELDERSNRLARRLRQAHLQSDALVAVCLDRSFDLIISMLATLKAGAAYLPIDPSYPVDRVTMILEDAKPSVILTQELYASKMLTGGEMQPVVCVDRDRDVVAQQDASPLGDVASPDSLAYVIYTSGSTGRPKGVMVTHRNASRLFTSTADWYNFGSSDVWTLFHSSAFDFSVWEIWGCLLTGGRLVCVPYWVARSPADFYRLLVDQQVTVLNQTPAAFYQLIQIEEAGTVGQLSLRYVIFGGEALNFAALRPWFARHGDRKPQLINMYAITETTVHVTYRPVTSADSRVETRSLIGTPIPDLRLYLLDSELRPVAKGEIGEIYVGGAGVARGYLNRPQLTAERFLSDPFADGSQSLMYKSGDLARHTETGDLEYLGRGDTQVKIRGFRIELGEIEATLTDHADVQQAVVVARKGAFGEPKLLAYFVPKRSRSPAPQSLRDFLATRLPEHMVPYAYEELGAFPLTINGKIDRDALPAPRETVRSGRELASTPMEAAVTEIWRQLLGVRDIGVTDNFFDLGGDSLLLGAMHSELRNRLRVDVPITVLFEFTTIRALARRLSDTLSITSFDEAKQRAQKQRAAFARQHEQRRKDRP